MLTPKPARPSARSSASMPFFHKPPTRPESIKRRSTLKRPVDEMDPRDIPSSPSKRSRVAFNADVEILSADDDEDLDPTVVEEQVRRAIQRHALHDDEAYESVRSIFNTSPEKESAPSTKVLRLHVQAMVANVSQLTRECSSLVHTILDSEWIGRDEAYYVLFVKFLGNLAAAQSGYVNKIMQVLANLLGPQKTRRWPDARPLRQPAIHRRTMQAIQYITQLVPTASGALADRIGAKLDFEFEKADDRMTYIKNFMELVKFVPELTSEVLTNVMRQLIKLDTAVQADLDEAGEDAEDEILQYMSASQNLTLDAGTMTLRSNFEGDDDDDTLSTSSGSDSEEDDDLDPHTQEQKKLKEDVRQVDMIMDILFRYYSKLTASTALQTRNNAIGQLIAQFHNLILPTYRSRHPQFLVFHFAQSDPIFVHRFVSSCTIVLTDKTQPQVLRHTVAAHISGFVGRGARVSSSVVLRCMRTLCVELSRLQKTYEPVCRGPDPNRFGDFYAIFQALIYIFCFRWRDIDESAPDLDDVSEAVEDEDRTTQTCNIPNDLLEALHDAIFSSLNPLRVCTPAIVEQFAKIVNHFELIYVYSKIEENKRVRMASSRWYSKTDIHVNQVDRDLSWVGDNGVLEGYFPYDPYHLPMSRHWIESDYMEWRGLPGESGDVASEEEEDDDNESVVEASDVGDDDDDTMDSDN